jgi:hypothetical protein
MGGPPGALEGSRGGGVGVEDVGLLTGLFPGSPGGTLGAPGDNRTCPVICCGII